MNTHASYEVTFLDRTTPLPVREEISAVFLLAFQQGESVLSVRNERGWDIPGGHLEEGEDLMNGLRREVQEEAGATFEEATPFAVLRTPGAQRVMLFFATERCSLQEFTPHADALERALLSPGDLIDRYYGDKALLRSLITTAQQSF
jgi:ADP-ribose pyrophosphatase YjhB (NUDIX family)